MKTGGASERSERAAWRWVFAEGATHRNGVQPADSRRPTRQMHAGCLGRPLRDDDTAQCSIVPTFRFVPVGGCSAWRCDRFWHVTLVACCKLFII